MTNYSLISKEIEALTSDVKNLTANLSNVSALLNMELSDINWVGFYLLYENTTKQARLSLFLTSTVQA